MRSLADEVPFDIPDSWEWVRLGSIVYNRGQITPNTDFCYIDIGSIDNKNQKLNSTDTIITPDKAPSRARKLVSKGDILYSTVRPYLHNMCIIDRDFSCAPIASTGFAALTCHADLLNKYLFYYMMSPDFDAYANNTDNAKGVAYPAINDDRLYKALIPIPPLGEQLRIVSAIESVDMPIRDYGVKEKTLRTLNVAFPEALKKSILQEAVQGKLVPQDPSDEPAEALLERIRVEKQRLIKEGKIKKDKHESVIFRRDNSHYEKLDGVERCIDDELPFEIPDFWEWVRISSIAALVTKGTTPRGGNVAYSDIGVGFLRAENVAGLDQLDLSKLNHIDEATHTGFLKRSILEADDVLITIAGTLGRTAIVKEENLPLNANQAVAIIRLVDSHGVDLRYLVYALNAPAIQDKLTAQKKITAIPNLTLEIISDCLIPIPPLNEQHRIVRRIEELFPLVKGL